LLANLKDYDSGGSDHNENSMNEYNNINNKKITDFFKSVNKKQ
jgi:hypothetical protein